MDLLEGTLSSQKLFFVQFQHISTKRENVKKIVDFNKLCILFFMYQFVVVYCIVFK
jgi:hypothetical protein